MSIKVTFKRSTGYSRYRTRKMESSMEIIQRDIQSKLSAKAVQAGIEGAGKKEQGAAGMIGKVNPSAVNHEDKLDHGCGFDLNNIPYSKCTEDSPSAVKGGEKIPLIEYKGYAEKGQELTEEQIKYAAMDVAVLPEIYAKQQKQLKELGLEKVFATEMSCIPATVWLELSSTPIDLEGAKKLVTGTLTWKEGQQ